MTAPSVAAAPPVREASKLGQFSWALFDWANQPFFTIITTFIFAPYFANVLVGDPVKGQSAWAFTQSASGILIALMSPFLGAMADAGGRRKPFILAFQVLLVAGCAGLWFAYPNRPDLILPISWAVILATVGAEMSIVFNNAQLPNIVRPERMGRLSGFGWGLGYCGGLISLFIVLAVSMPAMFGLAASNDRPLFGLDPASHELERLVGPVSALWIMIFVLPMFLFTPDSAGARRQKLLVAAREGGRSLVATLKRIPRFGNVLRYLIAFMLYNDGLAAIIAFGGVYAAATFGWSTVTLGIFGIILTVFAIPGAFLGGRLDDWIGSKRTVQLAIAGVIMATLGIVGVTATHILFIVPVDPISPTRGLFGSVQEKTLMGFALLLGFCMGPMQAASRTMVGRIAPHGMTGEFYGLFALSGRATAWMAPLAIGIITTATGSTRIGMACVLFFLVLGFILLWKVREERAAPRVKEDRMITAIVNFKLPADVDAKKAAELFKGSAPKYRGMKGLVRKYYLFDAEKRIGGGVYLWKSRADAEAVYTPQWQAYIAERYGAPPDIHYFETAVVVDNDSDTITADAA